VGSRESTSFHALEIADSSGRAESRAASERARSMVSEPLRSERDCGAVVLDSRRGQVSIESGASKTSMIGMRKVRF